MNENFSTNLDIDNDFSFDSDIYSKKISSYVSEDPVLNSEVEEEETREVTSEEDSETTEGYSGQTETVTEYPVDTLNSINTNLNTITGLLFVSLVLVGCGLVLKFLWGLLNK